MTTKHRPGPIDLRDPDYDGPWTGLQAEPRVLRLPARFAGDWQRTYAGAGQADVLDLSQTHILLRLDEQALTDLIAYAGRAASGSLPARACLGALRRAGIAIPEQATA